MFWPFLVFRAPFRAFLSAYADTLLYFLGFFGVNELSFFCFFTERRQKRNFAQPAITNSHIWKIVPKPFCAQKEVCPSTGLFFEEY
jgi:hypothetical protein